MTIFFYKRLTRNPEIGNTPVWILPNIWRLGRVMDTTFGTNVSNRMLLNTAKFQGYSFYRFWVIQRKPTGGGGGNYPRITTQIRLKEMCSRWYCSQFKKFEKAWARVEILCLDFRKTPSNQNIKSTNVATFEICEIFSNYYFSSVWDYKATLAGGNCILSEKYSML